MDETVKDSTPESRGGSSSSTDGERTGNSSEKPAATSRSGDDQRMDLLRSDVGTVERVIRRASKLQMASSGKIAADEEGLTDADILRIGEELGIDAVNVRQALVEVRAERVRPKKKVERGLAATLFGARLVRASRTVERPASEVQLLLEKHLADRECLAEVRRSPGSSVWVPATGLASKIQRGLNLGRRAYILAKGKELTLSVAAVDERACLVTLTADIGNLRREKAAGWSVGSIVLLAPAASALLAVVGLPLELSIVAGIGGAGTTAVSGTRVSVRNEREQMRLALNGLLERLALGVPLEEPRASFQERFLR